MRSALFFTATLTSLLAFPFVQSPAHAADWLYLTVPGDTLSQIGETYLHNPKDWPKVQSANKVPIPKHLPSNTRLKIPVELLKVTPAPVNVIAVTGTPRYKSGDGPYQPLKIGSTLNGGETVLTGPGASVGYRFADNTQLTQQASSKLNFGRLQSFGKTGMVSTELSLDSGRLEASAAKQHSPAGNFQVRTPVAVAGLRGTHFRLNVGEDGKTLRNEVTEGAIAVTAQGQQVQVESGFGTYVELGKPPSAPIRLLPPPDLAGLASHFTQWPVELSWPSQPLAQSWRIQLSTDADFRSVLHDSVSAQPQATWNNRLDNGSYTLRVRGIDPQGLEGFHAQHTFNLEVQPVQVSATPPTPVLTTPLIAPPTTIAPPAITTAPPIIPTPPLLEPSTPIVKDEGSVLFISWQGNTPAYRLEFSANPFFTPLLAAYTLTNPGIRLTKPSPGIYWLRVIAINSKLAVDANKQQESLPSPAASFIIQPTNLWWWLPR